MEDVSEFMNSRLKIEIEKLEEEIRDSVMQKKKVQEDEIHKMKQEIKKKNDIFKNYVKTKVKIISRENQILRLLKDRKSHEEIEDFIRKSSIQDLLKNAETRNSGRTIMNPEDISNVLEAEETIEKPAYQKQKRKLRERWVVSEKRVSMQTKQFEEKECFVKVYKLGREDEIVQAEEPSNIIGEDENNLNDMITEAEILLNENFGDVSRISTMLVDDSIQEFEKTVVDSDQAEIAEGDLIEQLLKDDNDVYDNITESSFHLSNSDDDFDFDVSTVHENEPIEVPNMSEEGHENSPEVLPRKKRKLKERWVVSENKRRKSARLSLSTKPNYTLTTTVSSDTVKNVPSEKMRRTSCQECSNCLRDDCMVCVYCKDKKKYGGPQRLKQKCIEKRCSNKN